MAVSLWNRKALFAFGPAILISLPSFAEETSKRSAREPVTAEDQPSAPPSALAPPPLSPPVKPEPEMFIGMRGGVAVPIGAALMAPTFGVEMGIARETGFGFGLHLLGAVNTPAFGPFTAMPLAFGVAADLRFYLQATKILTFYPSLSGGFLVGQNSGPLNQKANAMLPLLDPAFGTRVHLPANMYAALEFGMASFVIPFMGISIGYLPM